MHGKVEVRCTGRIAPNTEPVVRGRGRQEPSGRPGIVASIGERVRLVKLHDVVERPADGGVKPDGLFRCQHILKPDLIRHTTGMRASVEVGLHHKLTVWERCDGVEGGGWWHQVTTSLTETAQMRTPH